MITRITSHFLGLMPVHAARRFVHHRHRIHGVARLPREPKQLLVDVSIISRNDARTGIQRVVRSILWTLFDNPPADYRVCPVAATRKQGYHYAKYVPGAPKDAVAGIPDGKVHVAPGDIFLGLDLAANILPLHHTELMRWKQQGARLHFLIYDLLPVLHPHWFNPITTRNIGRWLATIAIFADGFMCISNVVKDDLLKWMDRHYGIAAGSIPAVTIPLGSDIEASVPTTGLSDECRHLLARLADTTSAVMVGTLEPRKGHAQVLAAFEHLWRDGADINLVIVGKPGWKTRELQEKLNNHPENKIRLYWLHDASDEMVQRLYETCSGVIVASEAEGFGLPLLEAAYYGKPVLARDIPVFREIAGAAVTYFSGNSSASLAGVLFEWINKAIKGSSLQTQHYSHRSDWRTTGNELIHCLQNSFYEN